MKYSQGKVESKSISKYEIIEIRKKVILESRKENLRYIIFSSIALLIIIGTAVVLFQKFRSDERLIEQKILNEKTEQYLYYIKEGDKWLVKKNWNNAIYEYLLAKKIFPDEYAINYRLVLAYGSKCEFEQSGCEAGSDLFYKLRSQFPEKNELRYVQQMFNTNMR